MVIITYVTNKESFLELDKTKLKPVHLNKLNTKDFVPCLGKICPRLSMNSINSHVHVVYFKTVPRDLYKKWLLLLIIEYTYIISLSFFRFKISLRYKISLRFFLINPSIFARFGRSTRY